MSGEGHDHSGRSQGSAWGMGVAAALAVYILSPPPLVWLTEKTGIDPPEPLFWIYYPLELAYNRLKPVKAFYDAYGDLIGVEM
jgi:hypothetical protein